MDSGSSGSWRMADGEERTSSTSSTKANTHTKDSFSHQERSIQLPPISSFTNESIRSYPTLPRLDHYTLEQPQVINSSNSRYGGFTKASASSSSQQPSLTKSDTSQSPYNTSPRLHFMSSLLRAADSSFEEKTGGVDERDSWFPTPSPMSVHSMLESSPSLMYTHADKRRRLDRSPPPPPSSPPQISSRHVISEEILNDEIHRKIAMANPAAIAAKKESRIFQPKPLSMSTSLRRRSFIPPALLASSTEYDRMQQPQHHHYIDESVLAPKLDYKRAWSSLDTHGAPLQNSSLVGTFTQHLQGSKGTSYSKHGRILSNGSNNDSVMSHELEQHQESNVRKEPSYHVNPRYSDVSSSNPFDGSLNQTEQAWASIGVEQKRLRIRESIFEVKEKILNGRSIFASSFESPITTIRCMYANIAQKSYGSEKRFLCPPPCVKIEGRSRICKWAHARVTSNSIISSNQSLTPAAGGLIGSEEEAQMDEMKREVRFGKLHVGTLLDSRDKSFRLHVALFSSLDWNEEGCRRTEVKSAHKSQESVELSQENKIPWCTLYTSGINVISKPARKSIRTRAASPAISSGSMVCLYNRLNSQTVRTKYLAMNTDDLTNENSFRLVARQEGWQSFSIELLAKPIAQFQQSLAIRNTTSSSHHIDHRGITYGSIICLRDVCTGTCSDPMMVCKVERGQVDLTGLIESNARQVRFQMVGKDRDFTRQMLIKRGDDLRSKSESQAWLSESSAISDRSIKSLYSTSLELTTSQVPSKKNTAAGIGGAVVQMQKVTLMFVSPKLIKKSYEGDLIECDLGSSRKYLSSAAYERGAPLQESRPALFRPTNLHKMDTLPSPKSEAGLSSQIVESTVSHPVGFISPPLLPIGSKRPSSNFIDYLEDPFSWTVVTISESSISYIEADPQAHLSSSSPSIVNCPNILQINSIDTAKLIIDATMENFYYSFSNQNPEQQHQHEIWIAQFGPLRCHLNSSTSASSLVDSNGKAEVSVHLPTIDHLLSIYLELNQIQDVVQPNSFRLPILFVRPEQGITFISDQVVQLNRQSNNIDAKLSWSVTIETQD